MKIFNNFSHFHIEYQCIRERECATFTHVKFGTHRRLQPPHNMTESEWRSEWVTRQLAWSFGLIDWFQKRLNRTVRFWDERKPGHRRSLHSSTPARHQDLSSELSAGQVPLAVFQPWLADSRDSSLYINVIVMDRKQSRFKTSRG